MGYTHYWYHRRRWTNAQWAEEVWSSLQRIIQTADPNQTLLGSWDGRRIPVPIEAHPTDDGSVVEFNGIGDDSHETFQIWQNRRPKDEWQKERGWDFCKTARKPYDKVVTACLVYLESDWPERFEVASDGGEDDWQAGLALAREALPEKVNRLAVPFDVRWHEQWVYESGLSVWGSYSIRRRVDGKVCILKGYRELARFAPDNEDAMAMIKRCLSRVPRSGRGRDLDRASNRAVRTILQAASIYGAEVPADAEA